MNVLIAVASKHGSTRCIGEAIAAQLRSMGIDAEVLDPTAVAEIGRYDAAIVGSAVYMGKWLPAADAFVRRHEAALRTVPVWLFSSGPLGGDLPQPPGDPRHLDDVMASAGARGHRVFSGHLDKDQLGLGERLIVRSVHAPIGDFRDWDAVKEWAREIGETLQTSRAKTGDESSTHPAA